MSANLSRRPGFVVAFLTLAASLSQASLCFANPLPRPQGQQQAATPPRQVVGAVKTISGSAITVKPDSGADVSVAVQDGAQIVRVAPGQTDLKNAPKIQLSDLQVGDRILVRGKPSDDGKSFLAAAIIAMKRSDVDAKQENDRQDWQKRGIGGLVKGVDPGTGTITISAAAAGTRTIAIHTAKNTIFRRYAPDSVQFDDAKPSALEQVQPGDQLRARGSRSADGSELNAEEIVSGVFRNIAGIITAVDAAGNAVTVNDLISKKPILVKVTPQSQAVKLPAQVAQGMAARLKATAAGNTQGGAPAPAGESARTAGGAQADLQQMVNRMPKGTLSDFQKGDAVMIVSTEGTSSGGVTAIMMLGGVEPLLAGPGGGQAAMTLSPWNIGGGDAGGEGAP